MTDCHHNASPISSRRVVRMKIQSNSLDSDYPNRNQISISLQLPGCVSESLSESPKLEIKNEAPHDISKLFVSSPSPMRSVSRQKPLVSSVSSLDIDATQCINTPSVNISFEFDSNNAMTVNTPSDLRVLAPETAFLQEELVIPPCHSKDCGTETFTRSSTAGLIESTEAIKCYRKSFCFENCTIQ